MVLAPGPVVALRLENSDAGNDPTNTSTRQAFDLLSQGFGPGFNGPLLLVAELPAPGQHRGAPGAADDGRAGPPVVVAVTPPRV